MSCDQLKRMKKPEVKNAQLSRAVSDLTLYELNLTEAVRGNFLALRVAASASTPSAYRSAGFAAHWVSIALRSARRPLAYRTKSG